MIKPTSKKIGNPTRNAATNSAQATRSRPNLPSSQSASTRPPPECSMNRPIIAPKPTTTAINPRASPKPDCVDFNTAPGAMPAVRPSAMLESINAKNACSLRHRIRKSSRAIEPRVRSKRPGPAAGMLSQPDLGFEPDQQHQKEHHASPRQRQRHHDTHPPSIGHE